MDDARPLHEVFDDLSATAVGGTPIDLAGMVREAGHGDLPPDLLMEALAGYAGTAPLAVAESLSDPVSAWSQGALDADQAWGAGSASLVGSGVAEVTEWDGEDPWNDSTAPDLAVLGDVSVDDIDSALLTDKITDREASGTDDDSLLTIDGGVKVPDDMFAREFGEGGHDIEGVLDADKVSGFDDLDDPLAVADPGDLVLEDVGGLGHDVLVTDHTVEVDTHSDFGVGEVSLPVDAAPVEDVAPDA